jgi:hypothetical protein
MANYASATCAKYERQRRTETRPASAWRRYGRPVGSPFALNPGSDTLPPSLAGETIVYEGSGTRIRGEWRVALTAFSSPDVPE